MKKDIFKLSKIKVIIFIIIIFFSCAYFPIMKCASNLKVKADVCKQYGLCTTDEYYSLSNVVLNYNFQENKYFCPDRNVSHLEIFGITLAFIIFSYAVAVLAEFVYKKFRDL